MLDFKKTFSRQEYSEPLIGTYIFINSAIRDKNDKLVFNGPKGRWEFWSGPKVNKIVNVPEIAIPTKYKFFIKVLERDENISQYFDVKIDKEKKIIELKSKGSV